MSEFANKSNLETKDYKERFEFRLTVGNNIICQRYFRINNFNERAFFSEDLTDTLRECAKMIDRDLRDKSIAYLEYTAPKCFKTEEEMFSYFENPYNRLTMHDGEGIVVGKGSKIKNYAWGKNNQPELINEPFDKGDYSNNLTDEDWLDYKLAFYDNGREVCSTIWTGCYPKAVRNSIDLSNKRGKCEDPEELSRLSYDRYVQYKMVEGKTDKVWLIIKSICDVCSNEDDWYITDINEYDNLKYAKKLKSDFEWLRKKYGQNAR